MTGLALTVNDDISIGYCKVAVPETDRSRWGGMLAKLGGQVVVVSAGV